MNSRQQMEVLFLGALNVTLVLVSLHLSIGIESVGYDGAAFLDTLDDKAVQKSGALYLECEPGVCAQCPCRPAERRSRSGFCCM